VKERVIDCMENQAYQYEELVIALGLQGDPGRTPLFDVVFAMQNVDMEGNTIGYQNSENPGDWEKDDDDHLESSQYELQYNISKFDLLLNAVESRGKIRMKLEYSTQLFKPSTIQDISGHYIEILQQVVDNPDIRLEDIKMSYDFVPIQSIDLQEKGDFGF
jgi:non-ribosomal peptide synthetase component F